ncbi:hypothetical protein CBS101457_006714 [Exobasidium rhododendri]|nr:hypothetical protein CBS101457_006714 [Exobasidium rhododendri]
MGKQKPPSKDNGKSFAFPHVGGVKKPRSLSTAEELVADQIYLYPNALTAQECQDVIHLFDSGDPDNKMEPSPPAKKGEAQRTNHRFSTISPEFAKQLYEMTGIRKECRNWPSMFSGKDLVPVGLSSNIRVYRYEPGAIFGCHYDDHSIDPHFGPSFGKSEWTLLFYLTGEEDGVEGGQTVFYTSHALPKRKTAENTIVAPLKRGAALFHRHGRVCMLHEALPPTKGTKWVLRSDLIFGKDT